MRKQYPILSRKACVADSAARKRKYNGIDGMVWVRVQDRRGRVITKQFTSGQAWACYYEAIYVNCYLSTLNLETFCTPLWHILTSVYLHHTNFHELLSPPACDVFEAWCMHPSSIQTCL